MANDVEENPGPTVFDIIYQSDIIYKYKKIRTKCW